MLTDKIITDNRIRIMGIVNVTPDSFSDGGKYYSTKNAVEHGKALIESGADIIDIGGESTRPGSEPISAREELNRVIPVIEEIINIYPDVIISIDTTKSVVAESAVKAGARFINDISGGTFDEKIFGIAAEYDVPFVIMHIQGTPEDMQNNPVYDDVVSDINIFFEKQIRKAKSAGISKIVLDPGIGFGKEIKDNYEILNRLNEFTIFKYPIMIGVSKKSFLGKSLNIDIEQRENSTIIAETISVLNGASIVRTHNVANAVELKKIISFLNKNVN